MSVQPPKTNMWCQELFQYTYLTEIAKLLFGKCQRSVINIYKSVTNIPVRS